MTAIHQTPWHETEKEKCLLSALREAQTNPEGMCQVIKEDAATKRWAHVKAGGVFTNPSRPRGQMVGCTYTCVIWLSPNHLDTQGICSAKEDVHHWRDMREPEISTHF